MQQRGLIVVLWWHGAALPHAISLRVPNPLSVTVLEEGRNFFSRAHFAGSKKCAPLAGLLFAAGRTTTLTNGAASRRQKESHLRILCSSELMSTALDWTYRIDRSINRSFETNSKKKNWKRSVPSGLERSGEEESFSTMNEADHEIMNESVRRVVVGV